MVGERPGRLYRPEAAAADPDVERWRVFDLSTRGFGLLVDRATADNVPLNGLLGLRNHETGGWIVGTIVRKLPPGHRRDELERFMRGQSGSFLPQANIAEVIAPPADRPVMNTRCRSMPCVAIIASIIWAMENVSPSPRRVSSGVNQLKHRLGLFWLFCSGNSVAKP